MRDLVQGQEDGAKSLLFDFEETQISNLAKALQAPVCEFVRYLFPVKLIICCVILLRLLLTKFFDEAIINLSPEAPKAKTDFKQSMHKTYIDCYRMEGFEGGDWGYAVNTDDTSGLLADHEDVTRKERIEEEERSLACYYLGWESVEVRTSPCILGCFEEKKVMED